jgi:peptidyl-prolyl cis-trans isomerase D
MALMGKMRENMTGILLFLLVMFVLSMTVGGLVGGADITSLLSGKKPDTVVSVNGEQISYEYYTQFRQQQIENYRQQNQKEPTGYELQQMEEQIYESIVRDILIKQLTQKMNIGVTANEIKYHIFNNPPQFILTNPSFADSTGNFDYQIYEAALADERNERYWDMVQNYLVESLPFQKIHQEVISSVFVTDDELKQDYIKKNQKVKAKYIFFDPNKHEFSDSLITKNQIGKYYKKNKEENYKEEEKRRIQYALFELKPTSSDTTEIKDFAAALIDSLNNGSDFARLAETYSEDPGSGSKGGDLGFFTHETMVKPFSDAAFSANIGEVVGPVLSQHGFHIIKVEDKKTEDDKEKVNARHILLKVEPSRNTAETVRDDANYFAEIASEEGFNQAVLNEKLLPDTTNFFTQGGFVPGLGLQKRMVETIFHIKPGKASRVTYIENKGYVIYELIEIQKEGFKPLADVEASIKSILSREEQKKMAGEVCRAFRERIQGFEDFEKLTGQDSIEIKETDFFAMTGYVAGVGRETNFVGSAFGLALDEVSGPVKGTRGYYLIKLIEKQDFESTSFTAQKENLKRTMLEQKQRTAYTIWYNDLKENADIKDYRYKFFN